MKNDEHYRTSVYNSDEHTDSGQGPVAFPCSVALDVPRPWYTDREYLLGGWTDARVWRAAVG
ncbi:hypothetical protein IMZ48_50020 [Candidatus Bathyarchaeota archaeon]|nr:hypothetical protein [Candidatus Bathyarchaeota archaeon]